MVGTTATIHTVITIPTAITDGTTATRDGVTTEIQDLTSEM